MPSINIGSIKKKFLRKLFFRKFLGTPRIEPGLGEKRERYLCALQPPTKKLFIVARVMFNRSFMELHLRKSSFGCKQNHGKKSRLLQGNGKISLKMDVFLSKAEKQKTTTVLDRFLRVLAEGLTHPVLIK